MNVIIIDDESRARNLLQTLLEEYCPQIQTIHQAENLVDGVRMIRKEQPQIVFLDVEMPEHLGVEILDFFDEEAINFHIIFTTGHQGYAIKAFELNAVDYLLKPLSPKKIKEALKKVDQRINSDVIKEQLQELKTSFKQNTIHKIGLPLQDGILFLEFDEIICMEAEGMYTKIETLHQKTLTISKPLKYFIRLLQDTGSFYRPHRSFYINLKHVKQLTKKDGTYIIMDNDKVVAISRDKRDEFLELFNAF